MFGLGGLGLKIAIAGIIAAVIAAAVGGFFLYQGSIVSGLEKQIADKQKTINTLTTQVAGLEMDKLILKSSNESLEASITRKSEETKNVFAEIQRLNRKDIESATRLQKVEGLLRDKNRMKRIDAIRTSRKASLLLRLMDRSVKCYAENFNKVEGRCVRGKWVDESVKKILVKPDVVKEAGK